MDNDNTNNNNNNKTSGKCSFDFNNLKCSKPTTTRSTTRLSTNIEANNQTISDASQTKTSKKMKIAKLDLFRDKDIDKIIAINESSTISSYILSVIISPPFSIKTTISDKAASDNKAVSGKAVSGKVVSNSSKSSSSSVKTVISKELPLDNNVTITIFKVTKTKVTDQS
ncbi:hypothetical protein RhiirC2_776667 [Rhizophagus irregularis]|uniref:Uncharacterized protein n=1 Tax=Rhizophagus irregularis TaxID=588596 RepID=A0A2N1NG70_9GLOM|nr:hypothetical protein RhiirC2_776667 [Rhizophagus irregularis]